MAVLKNRAKMSTSTTGTGTITLGSAEDGYQAFADAGVANADVVRYVIEDGSNWEIGTGTYTATGTTLSRTVSESSNSNNAINLSGSATVFIGATAEDIELSGNMAGDISSNGHAIKLGDRTGSGANELIMGAGDDFKLYHNGSTGHSIISETGSGNLQIAATNIELKADSGHALLTATYGGSVDLYHNSSKKAETTSSGLQTTGTLNVNGAYTLPTTDGTNGQVLTTDGSGAVTFADAGGGGGASLQTTEALVNGDLVSLNSTGTVSKVSLGGDLSAGSSTTVTTAGNQSVLNSTVATNGNGTFVTLYQADFSYPYVVAHTVSGTTITTGTPVVLRSSAQQAASAIIYDADQQKYLVVCPFSDYSQAFVISVSGTTITASSSTDLPQKGAGWSGDYDASQNKGVFLYNRSSDSDPYVVAATISGTSVSFNTPALVQNIGYAHVYELSYNSTAQKSVAFYTDDTGNVAYANAIGLSGSTFTIGSAVTVATGDKGYSFSIHGQSAVGFIYRDRANNLEAKARVGSISGTTITLGTEVTLCAGRSDYHWGFYDSVSGKIIFGFEDESPIEYRPATLSGTTITLGTTTTLSTGVSGYLSDKRISKNASGALMMQFQSYSPNGIHVIALEVSVPNIDDFIGIAGETIAANATGTINTLSDINTGQSSLTIGSKYYLQADGSLGTTVVAGKEVGIALSATDLLITYDPAATAGGGGSLTTASISGSSQTVDFTKDIVTSTVASKTTTFAFSGASAVDKTTLIIDNNYSEPATTGEVRMLFDKVGNPWVGQSSPEYIINPLYMTMSADGTKLFVGNRPSSSSNYVRSWTLSTAFDVTTASSSYTTYELSTNISDGNNHMQKGMQISPDGSKLAIYTQHSNSEYIKTLNMTSANDLSTVSSVSSATLSASHFTPKGLAVSQNGQHFYVGDNYWGNNNVDHIVYYTSSGWGGSATYQSTLDVTNVFGSNQNIADIQVSSDGTRLIVVSTRSVALTYKMTTAYDLSTAVAYEKSFLPEVPAATQIYSQAGVNIYRSTSLHMPSAGDTLYLGYSNGHSDINTYKINGSITLAFPSGTEIPTPTTSSAAAPIASTINPCRNTKTALGISTVDSGSTYQVTSVAESIQ